MSARALCRVGEKIRVDQSGTSYLLRPLDGRGCLSKQAISMQQWCQLPPCVLRIFCRERAPRICGMAVHIFKRPTFPGRYIQYGTPVALVLRPDG